jgi:N-acetylglutamate synthase-like GNAT family acetyltransferase
VTQAIAIRPARAGDIPTLTDLIDQSFRILSVHTYDEAQIEAAIRQFVGVDMQMIADGTYYVAEIAGEIAGCGGWSRRKQLYGRGQPGADADAHQFLDPRTDSARVRAFFVHPRWTRRGVGRRILQACEEAAAQAGFIRIELLATLTGVPLYTACGFTDIGTQDVLLPGDLVFPAVKMIKEIAGAVGAIAAASPQAA